MTNYPYDPELPFIVTWEGGESSARFPDYVRAADYAKFSRGKVIDTTPAPKIPADAEFIFWYSEDDEPYYARRYGNPANKVWETDGGVRVSEGELLGHGWVGDTEVVVLKRA